MKTKLEYGLLSNGLKVDGRNVPSYEIGGHQIDVGDESEAELPHFALSRFLGDCVVEDRGFRFFPPLIEQLEGRETDGLKVDWTLVEEAIRYCALWASFSGYEKFIDYDPDNGLASLMRFTEMLLRHRHTEFHVHGRMTPTKRLGRGQFTCCIENIYLDAELRRSERMRKLALEVTTRIEKPKP